MPKENSLPLPPRSGRLPPPVCMAAKSQDGEKTTVAAALAAALPAACIGIETKNLIMHASRSRPIMEIMRAPLARSCRVRARAAFSSTRGAVPGVSVREQRRRPGRLSMRAGARRATASSLAYGGWRGAKRRASAQGARRAARLPRARCTRARRARCIRRRRSRARSCSMASRAPCGCPRHIESNLWCTCRGPSTGAVGAWCRRSPCRRCCGRYCCPRSRRYRRRCCSRSRHRRCRCCPRTSSRRRRPSRRPRGRCSAQSTDRHSWRRGRRCAPFGPSRARAWPSRPRAVGGS